MRRLLLIPIAALAFVAGGCGGDDEESSSPSSSATEETTPATSSEAPASGTVTVTMKNIQFDPDTVEVKVGQTVKWVNEDTVDHNAIAEDEAVFKSKDFNKGGTFEYKADKAGTIKYTCTLHAGMDGTLEVR